MKNCKFPKRFFILLLFLVGFSSFLSVPFFQNNSQYYLSHNPLISAAPISLTSIEDKTNQSLGLNYALTRYNLTGQNITIAFVDTGLNLSHDAFARFNGIVPFYDVFEPIKGLQLGNPGDVLGHGTHIASIALGNTSLFRGIAINAKCVVVKIFNSSNPRSTDPEYLKQGLEWLLNYSKVYPIDIVSMSIGMLVTKLTPDTLSYLVKNFTDRGIVVVSSAGNDGSLGSETIYTPGTSPYAITVGAYNVNDFTRYVQSGQGPTNDGVIKPDILAPGVMELGADMNNKNTYFAQSGTSVAVPYVSGLVALLIQFCQGFNLSYSPAYLKWGLCLAAMKGTMSTDANQENSVGWGIIQLDPFLVYLDRVFNLTSPHSSLPINTNHSLYANSLWTELIPISLIANYTYSLSTNSSELVYAISTSYSSENGLPYLIASSINRNALIFQVNETSNYILVLKNTQFQSLDVKIFVNYWSPYPTLFISLMWIVGLFSLFGFGFFIILRRK